MARFLVWSDLHDEFWNGFELPDLSTKVNGVLIAGDTHTPEAGIWKFLFEPRASMPALSS